MKKPIAQGSLSRWQVLAAIMIAVVVGMTLLATAHARSAVSVTVTNNSQREIRHLYSAAGDPDNWGPDLLGGATIAPGASSTLNSLACDGSSLRLISEDLNGCFLYHNISCDANVTWTIAETDAPDCGGN